MFKNLFLSIALCAGIANTHSANAENWETSEDRATLATMVGFGALTSFLFWLPSTMQVISEDGVKGAIISTHIPRLALDLATMALCFSILTDSK